MTRQDQIIKAAREHCIWCKENCTYNPAEHFIHGVKWCEKHPNWTLASEKLPSEENGETSRIFPYPYLVFIEDEEVKAACKEFDEEYSGGYAFAKYSYNLNEWIFPDDKLCFNKNIKVIAWIELPKTPKFD